VFLSEVHPAWLDASFFLVLVWGHVWFVGAPAFDFTGNASAAAAAVLLLPPPPPPPLAEAGPLLLTDGCKLATFGVHSLGNAHVSSEGATDFVCSRQRQPQQA
jgi:hypothetical protein